MQIKRRPVQPGHWRAPRAWHRAAAYLIRENPTSRKVRKARARMRRIAARGNGRAVRR